MKSYERYISKDGIQKIHENTLRILSEVGIRFENERVLDIFKKHGAKTDGQIVYISEDLLNKALATAPSSYTVYTNNGPLTYGNGSAITSSLGSNIYVEDDGKIRKMVNQDVINQFKLGLMSPVLSFGHLNSFMDVSAFSEDQTAFGKMAILLRYSDKYNVSLTANTLGLANDKILPTIKKGYEIARAYTGITDKSKPIMSGGLNPLSPLTFDRDPLERLLASLDEGFPASITPCAMPLLTAPASLAGLLSTTNAEALGALTLCQLYAPGTGFLYGNVSGSTDMKTIQLCIGSPEAALIAYATAGLADLYSLPFRTAGGFSDAKDLDSQAGAESMMMIHAMYDSKADYAFHQVGCMGTMNVLSLEKFIIDEEIVYMVKRKLAGVDCSDSRLLFDEIKKVGPRGSFLYGRTPPVFREDFIQARFFNKDDPNNWQNKGSKSVKQAAKEEVMKRLSAYEVPERTKDQLKLLRPLLPDAYKDTI